MGREDKLNTFLEDIENFHKTDPEISFDNLCENIEYSYSREVIFISEGDVLDFMKDKAKKTIEKFKNVSKFSDEFYDKWSTELYIKINEKFTDVKNNKNMKVTLSKLKRIVEYLVKHKKGLALATLATAVLGAVVYASNSNVFADAMNDILGKTADINDFADSFQDALDVDLDASGVDADSVRDASVDNLDFSFVGNERAEGILKKIAKLDSILDSPKFEALPKEISAIEEFKDVGDASTYTNGIEIKTPNGFSIGKAIQKVGADGNVKEMIISPSTEIVDRLSDTFDYIDDDKISKALDMISDKMNNTDYAKDIILPKVDLADKNILDIIRDKPESLKNLFKNMIDGISKASMIALNSKDNIKPKKGY